MSCNQSIKLIANDAEHVEYIENKLH